MDIAALDLFIDVARRGGFAAVARARGLDPSQVSRSIAALEAELAMRLFQRTTRRLALTEAGALYLARIEPLVDELAAARDLAARDGGLEGRLRLTASAAYGIDRLVPLLGDFRREFPRLKLDLVLSDANLDLLAEHIDLAIRLGPSIPPGMIGVELHGVRYGLYAAPAYLAAAPPLGHPEDLARHRCLMWTAPLQRGEWRFERSDDSSVNIAVDGDFALSTPLALVAAARAGLGPTLLPHWLVKADVAAGTLVNALPGWRATTSTFGSGAWLIYPSRAWLPAKTRAVIDFLRARLGD